MGTAAIPVLVAAVLLGGNADQCPRCHREATPGFFAAYSKGVHADVSCSVCHGGDPGGATREEAHREDPGFRLASPRRELPGLCGSCPGEQLEEYLSDTHGRILTGREPGDPAATATCLDCHGAHASNPPEASAVPPVCGRCHAEEQRLLLLSAHAGALEGTGDPSCVSCHGKHRSTVPEGGLSEEVCSVCHESGTSAGLVASRKIQQLLRRVGKSITALTFAIERANPTQPEERRLLETDYDDVVSLAGRIRRESHQLDVAELERSTRFLEQRVQAAIVLATAGLDAHPGFSRSTVIAILPGVGLALLAMSVVIARLLLALWRTLQQASVAGKVPP